jgi:hypothetical protein
MDVYSPNIIYIYTYGNGRFWPIPTWEYLFEDWCLTEAKHGFKQQKWLFNREKVCSQERETGF